MKTILQPLHLKSEMDDDYKIHLGILQELLKDYALFNKPVMLGKTIKDADAIIFPQLTGEIFKMADYFKKIKMPIIIATSDFGTVNMWDWEIITFLKSKGLDIFAPYNIKLTKQICKSLALKRDMKKTKFLAFQDNPGVGMQAEIFKRFYWWEEQCAQKINEKFGITIIKKSFKELAEKAKKISDTSAEQAMKKDINMTGVSPKALKSAYKIYLAIKEEVEKDCSIKGAGINCLNESFYSDTTPCLAWSLLYEERGLISVCEADILTLLTMYMINKSIGANVVMSNLYPFLMGMAALKHEKISKFPDVDEPDKYLLVAHCGYFGMVPQCMAKEWVLRESALEIVDENAVAIDARLPKGNITITKLHPDLNELMVVKGELKEYAQYPGSDCRNGGLIKVEDGYKLMDLFTSHHNCIVLGEKSEELKHMARVFGVNIIS